MATVEAEIGVAGLRSSAEGRLGRLLVSSPFIGVALAILTWPIVSIMPATGPDPSWVAGLYMAHGQGLQFGRDLVFTYGPLGFLEVPALYEQAMWIVAFLYQAFVHVALAISLVWVARRALPLAVAVALCYALLAIGRLEGAAVLLAFVWCFVALDEQAPWFAVPLVAVGGGALGAIELLGKANYGIAILLFATLTVLALAASSRNGLKPTVFGRRHRAAPAAVFASIALGVFAACWLGAGQHVGVLPDFASRSAELISGYSSAMGTDIAANAWEPWAALAAIALLVFGSVAASWRDPLPRRIASIALTALFSFLVFKQGFVRQGLGNTPEFFVLVAAAGLAVGSRLPRQTLAALGLGAPLAALALVVLPTSSVWHSLRPEPHVEYMRQGFSALLSPGERRRLTSEARSSMRATYRLDPSIVRALDGRPVHVDPWEAGVAWDYDLNWQPLPVMQSYVAYTPQLDELNTKALSGPDGPATILRQATGAAAGGASVDDRYPGWESPAAMRAMLCHYQPTVTSFRWQLLERTADRCDPARPIGVVDSTTGRRIVVPAPPGPDEIVFARIDGLGASGWEALRAGLYRARERTATLDGRSTWTVVGETATDGLILRAPLTVDYPRPFQLAPDARTISFGVAGERGRPLEIEFFAQRVAQSPALDGR